MLLTAFATIPHSKDMKEHKTFKYCEQLQKQQADVTCIYSHSVALVESYGGLLPQGKAGNIQWDFLTNASTLLSLVWWKTVMTKLNPCYPELL